MRLQTEMIVAAVGHSPRTPDLNWSEPSVEEELVAILREELRGWISMDEAKEYADRLIATHRTGHLAVA